MVDNLLYVHVVLPHVLDLAVHQVQLTTLMGRGGYTEKFFSRSYEWLITCDYCVTPVPIGLGFGFGTALGLGLRGLDLGLGLDS